MLSPLSVAWSFVVDSGEELELLDWYLFGLNSELVVQFPLRSTFHAHDSGVKFSASLSGDSQGVGAAGVGPHVREGDLLAGALLEQEALVGIEQENGKGAMKESLIDVGHQMACQHRENGILV